ncbi:hypothetical protein HK097_006014, partial [Rhizophlyctis rosea]
MSAGKICELKIIFRPPDGFDEDVEGGTVWFEAEYGGRFGVGIGCRGRRCRPTVFAVGGGGRGTVGISSDDFAGGDVDGQESDGEVEEDEDGGGKGRRKVAKVVGPRTVEVDFDTCMVGANVSRTVHLRNEGTLPTDFVVIPSTLDSGTPSDASSPFSIAPPEPTTLSSYATQAITLTFAPPYTVTHRPSSPSRPTATPPIRKFTQTFLINFARPGVAPMKLVCKAGSTEAPLMINTEVMDFKLCIAGRLYRDRIVLRNRHSTALKFWVDLGGNEKLDEKPRILDRVGPTEGNSDSEPKQEFKQIDTKSITTQFSRGRTDSMTLQIPAIGEVEISPRLAFVQPYEPFSVWLKLRPSIKAHTLLQDRKFCLPLTIKYMAADVECPIPLKIVGGVAVTDVEILGEDGGEMLDFGECSVWGTKTLNLRLRNGSRLAQTVRLSSSNASFKIDTTPVHLLPSQELIKEVRFEPVEEGHVETKLVCESVLDWR